MHKEIKQHKYKMNFKISDFKQAVNTCVYGLHRSTLVMKYAIWMQYSQMLSLIQHQQKGKRRRVLIAIRKDINSRVLEYSECNIKQVFVQIVNKSKKYTFGQFTYLSFYNFRNCNYDDINKYFNSASWGEILKCNYVNQWVSQFYKSLYFAFNL